MEYVQVWWMHKQIKQDNNLYNECGQYSLFDGVNHMMISIAKLQSQKPSYNDTKFRYSRIRMEKISSFQ